MQIAEKSALAKSYPGLRLSYVRKRCEKLKSAYRIPPNLRATLRKISALISCFRYERQLEQKNNDRNHCHETYDKECYGLAFEIRMTFRD